MKINRIPKFYLTPLTECYMPQNHYPSCGSPKELCDNFANFFCHKIMTIRHQLDTLSITDAPAFPWIDEAIISCELSKFSPTSEDELSGLLKKIAAKLCSLDPVPASLLPLLY